MTNKIGDQWNSFLVLWLYTVLNLLKFERKPGDSIELIMWSDIMEVQGGRSWFVIEKSFEILIELLKGKHC